MDRRLAIHHEPNTAQPLALVVYVHPFAEEMNKSRRMAALAAQRLAAAGCAVLQLDLLGCGDSSGDFGDATWAQWREDVLAGVGWLRKRHAHCSNAAPTWLWGLRAGCLLAAEAAPLLSGVVNLLFWQPPTSGKALLQQFLRLRTASEMLTGADKGGSAALRQRIDAGQSIDVAGYTLHPELCCGLERASLRQPSPPSAGTGRVEWIELRMQPSSALTPLAQQLAGPWREAGWALRQQLLVGPAFWQTTEIEDAPALLCATVAAVLAPITAAMPGEQAGALT